MPAGVSAGALQKGRDKNNKDFRIAIFDTKPYDRAFFEEENKKYGFDITCFEAKLRPASPGAEKETHSPLKNGWIVRHSGKQPVPA